MARVIQEDASALGFDWPDITGVLDKVREETLEIEHALAKGDCEHARDELGDLLFSAVNLSRFLDADPCGALHRTTQRFQRRFALVKREFADKNLVMRDLPLEELDAAWERAKSHEKA